MKSFLRIFKWIAIGLTGLILSIVLLASGALAWIYYHPAETYSFVEKHFFPEDLKITWQSLAFKGRRLEGFSWDIDFKMKDLNVAKAKPQVDVTIDELELLVQLNFFSEKPMLTLFNLRLISDSPVAYWMGEDKDENEINFYEQSQSYLDYVKTVKNSTFIEQAEIKLSDIRVHQNPQGALYLDVMAVKQKSLEAPLLVSVRLRDHPSSPPKLDFQGEAILAKINSPEKFLKAQLDFDQKSVRLRFPFEMTYDNETLSGRALAKVEVKNKEKSIFFDPALDFALTPKELSLKIQSSIFGLPPPLVKINSVQGQLTMPLEKGRKWADHPVKFYFQTGIDLFFIDKNMRPPLEKSCQCRIPETLLAKFSGEARIDRLMGSQQTERPILDLRAEIDSVKNKLFSLDFSAGLQASRGKEKWLFEPSVEATAVVHSFQGFRKFLDSKEVIVPAPLSVLDGEVALRISSPLKIAGEGALKKINLAAELTTDLKSANQLVKTKTQIELNTTSEFKEIQVLVRALIEDLQLELPPLDPIAGVPKAAADRRILRQKPESKPAAGKKVNFIFDLAVVTARPGAIRLFYPLAKPYIPLTLNVARDQELTGKVKVEPFDIQYLRRTVQLKTFEIDMQSSSQNDFPIKGEFQVQQTDYRVHINVGGTLRSPQLTLSSEPYLNREDIISVLLYDRINEELVGGDAETAGQVQAAIADRAIGLFGLWAFASTPIQSFSYNPLSKVYSATINLGDGLTASVGTAWDDSASFELRKRLSQRWIIAAGLAPNDSKEEVGTAKLQWEKRF